MTTMNQFAQSLLDGEFPVSWSNNFANYGLPLPLFAHQLPAYLGAVLILLGLSTSLSYNLIMFFGVAFSSFLFYLFLRNYFSKIDSLVGVIVMNYFPYRIINIYIRGGLPEILASGIFPLLLLSIYKFNVKKQFSGLVLLTISILLLALCHPMMLVIYSIPSIIYFLVTINKNDFVKNSLQAILFAILGVGMSTYYLLPLLTEMKYFYQGLTQNAVSIDNFLRLENFLNPYWYYFLTHPGPRGNFIKFGLIETISLAVVSLIFFLLLINNSNNLKLFIKKHLVFIGWIVSALVTIFLLIPISFPLYKFKLLREIQYPWRFLSVIQFSLPFVLIYTLNLLKLKSKYLLLFKLVLLILFSRTPQLYGKNYIEKIEDSYYFTQANLHSSNLNTIWSGKTDDYPKKDKQLEIIEGDAVIENVQLKNASRNFTLLATSDVRIVDYTFYFPGWTVKNNDQPVEIEFQDPELRGLITYRLPKGNHHIEASYQPTRVRLFSRIISLISTFLFMAVALVLKRIYFIK